MEPIRIKLMPPTCEAGALPAELRIFARLARTKVATSSHSTTDLPNTQRTLRLPTK